MDVSFSRPADADLQAEEIRRPQSLDDRLYTVMTTCTAALDQLYSACIHIEIIMNNQQMVRFDFVEPKILPYRIAAAIHESERLDEE